MTHAKDLPISPTKDNMSEPTAGLLGMPGLLGMDLKEDEDEGDEDESNDELFGEDDDEPMEEEDKKVSPEATSSSNRNHGTDPPRAAEEAHPVKIRPSPILPSPKEVDEHYATHCPYRTWCPVCVKASGHEAPHKRRLERDEETGFPVISMDYEALEDEIKFLALKDEVSGGLWSYDCESKGPSDAWVVRQIVRDLEDMGRKEICLKSDNEPAMLAMQKAIATAREATTLPRNSPEYDPQSNGGAEKAAQDITDMTRRILIGLEARLKTKINLKLPIVTWIIRHAPFVLNRYRIGKDGHTAWRRLTGKDWNGSVAEFGEQVLGKLALKKPGTGSKDGSKKNKGKRKLADRSVQGTWLGIYPRTREHIIELASGKAIRVRTIHRLVEEKRWCSDAIFNVRSKPRKPNPDDDSAEPKAQDAQKDSETRVGGEGLERPETADGIKIPRELQINTRLMEKFGFTNGCPGCIHKQLDLDDHRPHSAKCRRRFYELMKDDEDEVDRLLNNERRMGRRQPKREKIERPSAPLLEKDSSASAARPSAPLLEKDSGASAAGPDTPKMRANEQDEDGVSDMLLDEDDIPYYLAESADEVEADEAEREASRRRRSSEVEETEADEPKRKRMRESAALLNQLNALLKTSEVGKIIEELNQSPEFQMPKSRGPRKRLTQDGWGTDCGEVYSPPRVTKVAAQMGLKPAWALDLTTLDPEDGEPWDFDDKDKRSKAMRMLDQDKPLLLVVSPMCGPFSAMNNINYSRMTVDEVRTKIKAGMRHVKFALELCLRQYREGRLFLFEHPASASSWSTEMMRQMLSLPGVMTAKFDFCQLGMKTTDEQGAPAAAKKRTTIMTNSPNIGEVLRQAQCTGAHKHEPLVGGKAKQCEVYPDKFVDLLCQGIRKEMQDAKWRGRMARQFDIGSAMEQLMAVQTSLEQMESAETKATLMSLSAAGSSTQKKSIAQDARPPMPRTRREGGMPDERETKLPREWRSKAFPVPPHEESHMTGLYDGCEFYDDISGVKLDHRLAVEARKKEIDFFKARRVYTKRAREPWMKVIRTKWLDVNKGDETNPNIWARLVGCEVAKEKRDDLFAATPPLECFKLVTSICASNQGGQEPFRMMAIDVSRAYFYAPAKRPIFIEIPAEDREAGDAGTVAQLNLSVYGTRDAAQNWIETYTQFLTECGCVKGLGSSCNFQHKNGFMITVHGDDFTVCGSTRNLKWLRTQFEKKFEITCQVLGPEQGQQQEVRILNRVLRWGSDGIEYEADQRHAEIVIRDLGLDGAKALDTPGTREDKKGASAPWGVPGVQVDKEDPELDEELEAAEATLYRGITARLNYLAQDRTDLQYSCKEASRRMARPRKGDWRCLKRIGRYLIGAPRYVQTFWWQLPTKTVRVFTDSDWAGCPTTCRSTSGGVMMLGSHCIKTWSTTQATVALSSAEAELYALTKGASQALGLMSLLDDLGQASETTLYTDASAAIGIVRRSGLGKLRHLNVRYLWLQDQVRTGQVSLTKVKGTENPADLVTKHVTHQLAKKYLEELGASTSKGRAKTAPVLAKLGIPGGIKDRATRKKADRWLHEECRSTRVHHMPRTCLFTPCRVNGAPPIETLQSLRITEGKYVDDGEVFRRTDEWKNKTVAHLDMGRLWVGSTRFMLRQGE